MEEETQTPEDRIRQWLNLVSKPGNWFEHPNTDPVLLVLPQEEEEEEEEEEESVAKIEAAKDEAGEYSGPGLMTFANGDYFEGDFLGRGTDRKGILTRLSDSGALTEGSWISGGRMSGYCEVEFVESGEWSQSVYDKGLKVGTTTNELSLSLIHI